MVLAVDYPWPSCLHLAALVRRKGCRTVLLTSGAVGTTVRLAIAAAFDQWLVLPSLEDALEASAEELVGPDAGPVVDVMASETSAGVAAAIARELPSATTSAVRRADRHAYLADKWVAGTVLRRSGLAVPPRLLASAVTPEDAFGVLGAPLMVKRAVGQGGRGVSVAADPRVAERALKRLSHRSRLEGPMFYEARVPGRELTMVAAFAEGRVFQRATMALIRDRASSVGPARAVATVDLPGADETVAAIAAAVGGSGLLAADVIRDDDGVDWVIDVNLRTWGSIGALLGVGIDFSEGYLQAVGVRAVPIRATTARTGRYVSITLSPRRVHPNGRAGTGPLRCAVQAWRRSEALGARYVAAATLAAVLHRAAPLRRLPERLLVRVFGGVRRRLVLDE